MSRLRRLLAALRQPIEGIHQGVGSGWEGLPRVADGLNVAGLWLEGSPPVGGEPIEAGKHGEADHLSIAGQLEVVFLCSLAEPCQVVDFYSEASY
jgi:hypothetical protein